MSVPDLSRFVPKGLIRNQEQINIQLSKSKILLIEANAGAAKTTTLTLRIGEALANNMVPEDMLALVFTPTARDVMRQRLLDVGIPYDTVNRISIVTFEDFSKAELLKIEDGGVKNFSQIRHQKQFVIAAIEKVYKNYSRKIEYLQLAQHNIAITQFLEAQLSLKAKMGLDDEFDLDDLETIFDRLGVTQTEYLTAIEYERIRLGYNDYPLFRGPFDATYDLARHLSLNQNISANFFDYRLVVCDELHDLNEAAFRIVASLIEKTNCYFMGAGDKDQVIHSTLGASQEFLDTKFEERFSGLKRLPLTITYRHGPHLAYPMQKFKDKVVESYLAERTEIQTLHYDEAEEDCANQVVEAIRKWKKDGFSIDGCAILMRDRHQSIVIETALQRAQISYRTPLMASYLQREEILFLRGVMAIALNDLESVKSYEVRSGIVEALAIFAELEIDDTNLEKAKYEVAKEAQLIWEYYQRYICRNDSNGQANLLDLTIKHIKNIDSKIRADVVLREICDRMSLDAIAKKIYIRPHDASVVTRSISGFLRAAKASNQTFREFWETINSAEAFITRKKEKGFVTLDCVANSKGREFQHVILPFLEIGEFPNPMFEPQGEENLFYVGVTRTKSRVTLITPSDKLKRSGFIAQMNIAETVAAANLAVERNETYMSARSFSRQYLRNTYHDRVLIKSMGAKFDGARKAWYVDADIDIEPFKPWL